MPMGSPNVTVLLLPYLASERLQAHGGKGRTSSSLQQQARHQPCLSAASGGAAGWARLGSVLAAWTCSDGLDLEGDPDRHRHRAPTQASQSYSAFTTFDVAQEVIWSTYCLKRCAIDLEAVKIVPTGRRHSLGRKHTCVTRTALQLGVSLNSNLWRKTRRDS